MTPDTVGWLAQLDRWRDELRDIEPSAESVGRHDVERAIGALYLFQSALRMFQEAYGAAERARSHHVNR
jgi:hypothetical protein